jgi:hypothetical protein
MDVADVDQLPVMVLAGIVALPSDRLVGDVAFLPYGHLTGDRGHVRSGAQLHVGPAVLRHPLGEIARVAAPVALRIVARDDREREMTVVRIGDDAGHPIIGRLAGNQQRQGPAERIGATEPPLRLAGGEHERVRLGERRRPVAAQERQFEDVEKRTVGEDEMLRGRRLSVLDDGRVVVAEIDDALDLREILSQRRRRGDRRHLQASGRLIAFGAVPFLELEDAAGVGEPGVVGKLVTDEQQDEHAGGEAEGEAENVDRGIKLVPGEHPEGDRQIIPPHGQHPLPPFFAGLSRAAGTSGDG